MAVPDKHTVNKAIQYTKPGTTETCIAELPIDKPGMGEVLVRMLYSGICHTDYASVMNELGKMPPVPIGQVGGHEGIGEVIEQGPGVTYPAIGAKVGIKWAAEICLSCDNCLMGVETECTARKISGFYHPGTFQQYLISSAHSVTVIPDGIDLAGAAPMMCAGLTVYTALKRAGTKAGDWVLISGGGGGLGHLAIQFAKAMGAGVVALDVGSKEAFCNEVGATFFVDFTKFATDEELAAEVNRLVPGGVNVVLVCASSAKAYIQAPEFLAVRGTLVCLGVPATSGSSGPPPPVFGVGPFLQKELKIIGLKAGNRQEAKECLDIVARGLVKTRYQLRSMDSLEATFAEMEKGSINGRVVLDLR